MHVSCLGLPSSPHLHDLSWANFPHTANLACSPSMPLPAAVGSASEQQRWEACLRAMQLSGEQQEHLLLSRRAHLQRMRTIYQERHNLNMQVRTGALCCPSRVQGCLDSMALFVGATTHTLFPCCALLRHRVLFHLVCDTSNLMGTNLPGIAHQCAALQAPTLCTMHCSLLLVLAGHGTDAAPLQPQPRRGQHGGGAAGQHEPGGYLPVAKSSAELSDVLDKIKVGSLSCVHVLLVVCSASILTPVPASIPTPPNRTFPFPRRCRTTCGGSSAASWTSTACSCPRYSHPSRQGRAGRGGGTGGAGEGRRAGTGVARTDSNMVARARGTASMQWQPSI